MSGTYHLHKWSIYEGSPDPYQAPELSGKRLFGFRDSDSRSVITSAIIKVEGTTITTRSGSVYILEDIDPEYLTWMNEHGYTYDPLNPIKIKKQP